jgi:threonine dehydrogenase-like Zn-dependent dehydrogenase
MPQYRGYSTWVDRGREHVGITHDITYPIYLGHEPAGVVLEKGSAIKHLNVGDKVTGLARYMFASHGVYGADRLIPVPEGVALKEALGEPLMCCANIVRAASPELGDNVAVIGCGAMGLLVLSGLAHSPCKELIALDLMPERLSVATELGATRTMNPKETDVIADIEELTGGKRLDIVVEISGTSKGLELATRLIRERRGKILIPSYYGEPIQIDAGFHLMVRSPIIHSTHPWYSMDYVDDLKKGVWAFAKGIFPMGRMITHEFSLDDIGKGFEIAETGKEGYLKGIIVP